MKLLIFFTLTLFFNKSYGDNTSYISLSNMLSKSRELQVQSNNAANTGTIGYHSMSIITTPIKSKKSKDSYVIDRGNYYDSFQGSLIETGRNLDLAILGDGYFKIFTPNGVKYSLDGRVFIASNGVLVNGDGFPFSNQNEDTITIPPNMRSIEFAKNGEVYVNEVMVAQIGVFIAETNDVIFNGSNLFTIESTVLVPNPNIATGFLRGSNANPTLVMTKIIEVQRSYDLAMQIAAKNYELKNNMINKLSK